MRVEKRKRSRTWFGRHPLRLRLTLLYCLVSVMSSAALLGIMWALAETLDAWGPPDVADVADDSPLPLPEISELDAGGQLADRLEQPLIALAIMAVISLLLGWLIAGRVLRPVLTMTQALRQISDRNVHERLALPGRRTELTDLADTVDGLLGRLETALDAQRGFVANAAHEMRTPLTVEHALLEEPLIDPAAGLESFRSNFARLLVISEQRGQLLESLLTLSSSEQGRGPTSRWTSRPSSSWRCVSGRPRLRGTAWRSRHRCGPCGYSAIRCCSAGWWSTSATTPSSTTCQAAPSRSPSAARSARRCSPSPTPARPSPRTRSTVCSSRSSGCTASPTTATTASASRS